MTFFSLSASPTLETLEYFDVDRYRHAVRAMESTFTPLVHKISVAQMLVHLPGCDISFERSFPRTIDSQLGENRTAILLPMDDDHSVRLNGDEMSEGSFAFGRGGSGYISTEHSVFRFSAIVFTPEVHGRGWPSPGKDFSLHFTKSQHLSGLRRLVLEIAAVASAMTLPTFPEPMSAGMKETLLSAIDQLFSDREPMHRFSINQRQLSIVRSIEDVLTEQIQAPIYSEELASAVGVSVRTMHNAVFRIRGMPLHQYLRIKRLWLVRRALLAGSASIKSSALAFGFWHLGDFSRSYRAHFGELPSDTVARATRPF
jgi:AraC family ethanolamine operon transcriptional activator